MDVNLCRQAPKIVCLFLLTLHFVHGVYVSVLLQVEISKEKLISQQQIPNVFIFWQNNLPFNFWIKPEMKLVHKMSENK